MLTTEWLKKFSLNNDRENFLESETKPGDIVLGFNLDNNGKPAILHLKDRFMHKQAIGPTGAGKTAMALAPEIFQDLISKSGDYPGKHHNVHFAQIGQILIEPKGDFSETFYGLGKWYAEKKRESYIQTIKDMSLRLQNEIKKRTTELNEVEDSDVFLINASPDEIRNIIEFRRVILKRLSDSYMYLISHITKKEKNSIYFNSDWFDAQPTYGLFLVASSLCDLINYPIETNDFIDRSILDLDDLPSRDVVLFFDPTNPDCPKFNPMGGTETQAVKSITNTFATFNSSGSPYFATLGSELLTKGVKLVKRIYGSDGNLHHLNILLNNSNGKGQKMVAELRGQKTPNQATADENQEIASWFDADYFQPKSKSFQDSSNVRSNLSKIMQDPTLFRIFTPNPNDEDVLDFNDILRRGDKVAISTAQGFLGQELSSFLGIFLMQQIQQSVFARKGEEDSHLPVMLTVDECQLFVQEEFADILSQGRSYNIGVTLATQTRSMIKEKAGEGFLSVFDSNCRNIITFPGLDIEDAKHFELIYGTHEEKREDIAVSHKDTSLFERQEPDSINTKEIIEEKSNISLTQVRWGKDFYRKYDLVNKARENNEDDENILNTFGHFYYQIMNGASLTITNFAECNFIPMKVQEAVNSELRAYHEQINANVLVEKLRVKKEDLIEKNDISTIDANESPKEKEKKLTLDIRDEMPNDDLDDEPSDF